MSIDDYQEFIDSLYEMSLSDLCKRIEDKKGENEEPILFSVLCNRVELNEFEKTGKSQPIKKHLKMKKYNK